MSYKGMQRARGQCESSASPLRIIYTSQEEVAAAKPKNTEIGKVGRLSYDFDIRAVPVELVICRSGTCRHDEISRTRHSLLRSVYDYLRDARIEIGGPPFCRYVSWREKDCDIDVGFPLLYPVYTEGNIRVGQIGGGGALHTFHKGPHRDLGIAHAACLAWMEEHRKTRLGPPWDVYLTGPGLFPDPNDWVTEIFYPVR